MRKIKLLSAFGAAFALQFAQAGSITDVKISKVSSEEQLLQVTFDSPAPAANSFATSSPPRIAFDFSGTSVKLANPNIMLENNLVRSATAVSVGDRARLVLNLSRNANYSSEVSGNSLLIHINTNKSQSASAAPVERLSATKLSNTSVYKNSSETTINFHRGTNGSGRVEINLPANNVPVDIHREGAKLFVSLAGVPLPHSQERKLNVTDFATPINEITASNVGNNGRLVIKSSGIWDFSSYQTNRKLVVDVISSTKAKSTSKKFADNSSPYALDTSRKVYKGDKLTLNFQDVEIRTVLQSLADFTHTNIVTSDSVKGNITLRLQDVPWDQAMDLILDTKGLGKKVQGNIIRIAPISELMAADTEKLQALQKMEGLEPLVSETFALRYKKVEEFKGIIDSASNTSSSTSGNMSGNSGGTSILSSRGSALIDPRTNTLIINDTQSVINKIRSLVDQLDVPLKQVLIEARIVEANDDFARDLGVKLGFNKISSGADVASTFKEAVDNTAKQAHADYDISKGNFPTDLPTMSPNVNLPAALATNSIAVLTKMAGGLIGLELSAMQTENKGKIISSPRILTADRTEASIEEGKEISYEETSPNGATTSAFKKAVLGLKVTPQITPDGNIIMDLDVTKNDVLNVLTGALSIKEIKTQVMVENGGTVVIGGIYEQIKQSNKSSVPFLSDIPLIGLLFKNSDQQNKRSELLVFITPRLIDSSSLLKSH